MPITSIKKRGNRRSVNNPEGGTASTTETDTEAVTRSDKPQVSSQIFVNPGPPPIRNIPSIKEVLEPRAQRPAQNPEPAQEVKQEPVETPNEEPAIVPKLEDTIPEEPKPKDAVAAETQNEDFETCWRTMFEEIFSSVHMIYHPLKDQVPAFEDGIIKVEVLNDFQKEQYEMRKRAILEYWRSHFKINVDDIEIVINDNMETKKIIYSAEDKVENMMEQNPKLADFLRELNFRIRD